MSLKQIGNSTKFTGSGTRVKIQLNKFWTYFSVPFIPAKKPGKVFFSAITFSSIWDLFLPDLV
jgi:hypothetical protein